MHVIIEKQKCIQCDELKNLLDEKEIKHNYLDIFFLCFIKGIKHNYLDMTEMP